MLRVPNPIFCNHVIVSFQSCKLSSIGFFPLVNCHCSLLNTTRMTCQCTTDMWNVYLFTTNSLRLYGIQTDTRIYIYIYTSGSDLFMWFWLSVFYVDKIVIYPCTKVNFVGNGMFTLCLFSNVFQVRKGGIYLLVYLTLLALTPRTFKKWPLVSR
jgi:hypothetical protein